MGVFVPYNDDFIEEYYDEDRTSELVSDLPQELKNKINLYLKVGLYCGWDWEAYDKVPLPVIDYISEEIDRRLKPYISAMEQRASKSGKSGKPTQLPLDFNHLAILLALSTMGGDD